MDHRAQAGEAPGELSLLNKIQLKPDTPMRDWLDAELKRRFDYVCAPDLERFRRERQAITRAGQIKSGTIRHEKDDRHDINDRTRFVLGWRNEAKIAALTEQREGLEKRIAARAAEIAECQKQLGRIEQRLGDLGKLEMFERFERIDWRQCSLNIDRLDTEARDLEAQSDILAALRRQRTELDQSMAELRQNLDDLREKRGGLRTQLEETRADLADTRTLLGEEASDDPGPGTGRPRPLATRRPGRGRHQPALDRGAPARVPRISANRHRPRGQAHRTSATAHRRTHERFPQPLAAGDRRV
jgi:uncharacterized protein YPO0396